MKGDVMNRKWPYVIGGIGIGILIMMVFHFSAGTGGNQTEDMQENESEYVEEDVSGVREESAAMESDPVEEEESVACEESAAVESDGVRVSDHVEIPQDFMEEMLLYQYIEYGIRKYNEDNNSSEHYYVELRDMLPYDTKFYMQEEDKEPFRTDLAKEIIPELSDNLYNFELKGEKENIYMQIDTHSMKIYIYDGILPDTESGDGEAGKNSL